MQKLIILDDVFDAATVQAIASFDYGDGLERWYALGCNPVHEKILAICGEHFDLSGIAGYEMYSLYQSLQYYQTALDRFYAHSPLVWESVQSGAAQSFVTPESIQMPLGAPPKSSRQ